MGNLFAIFTKETFIANSSIPGQTDAVLAVAEALHLSKFELDIIYTAFLQLHTEGIQYKVIISYVLILAGALSSAVNRTIFKVFRLIFLRLIHLFLIEPAALGRKTFRSSSQL